MKRTIIVLVVILLSNVIRAQYVYTIKADSVKITNSCDTAELIIENHTQTVPGFLFNKGRGRTEFRRGLIGVNETTYLIGADTLDLDKVLGGRYFKQGGNTFGAAGILGLRDNYPLTFIQKGIEKGRIDTSGNWLFNTTKDKGYLAQFNGHIWQSGALLQEENINIHPVGGVYGDARINIGSGNSVIGHSGIAIGSSVNVNANGEMAVGIGFDITATYGIGILGSTYKGTAIGDHSYAHEKSVALGQESKTTTSNQFVCGAPDMHGADSWNKSIANVYFGSGVQRNERVGPGLPYVINGSGGFGNDTTGGDIGIAGGKGTGAGTPGNIIFSTAVKNSSGTTLQSLSEKARIVGASGNILINTTVDAGYKLHVNGTTLIADTLKLPNIISKVDTAGSQPMAIDNDGNVYKMSSWSFSAPRKSVNVTGSSYTVPAGIDVIFVNYAAGQATITLPTGTLDREITIKNLHTTNTVVIAGLDSSESNSIAARGAITVKYTGNAWVGISKY
jgi:hypothetical protein